MTCSSCGRLTTVERLPRGSTIRAPLVLCRECRRQRFRLRFVTMVVAEPIRAEWQEFRIALEELWRRATPCCLTNEAWELATVEGQHIVRVLIGDQWWALRIYDAKWSRARAEAFERIAAGEAAAGRFSLYPRPTFIGRIDNHSSRSLRPYEIACKTVAWLPREQSENLTRPQPVLVGRASQPDPSLRNQNIEEIPIMDLRRAIRANWISFPSQVPTFPNCGPRDLQRRIIQLYFLMGWNCAKIAARYGLVQDRVRSVLTAWKCRAANAGYLQHIPPAEVIRPEMLASSVPHDYGDEHPCPAELRSTAHTTASSHTELSR